MKTEIGSEFWSVPTTKKSNDLFPKDTKWFVSGRSALRAIIKENNFKSVAMPHWCCDSMIVPFVDNGITVSFYDAFNPPKTIDTDALLVMDYFGYATEYTPENYDGVVIRDLTHSIFSKKYDDADYYFGSLRKWAGFYTGGYACGFKQNIESSGSSEKYVELRKKAMQQKHDYISGKTENKNYLSVFSTAEGILEDVGILPADNRDIEIAKYMDIDFIKASRRKNAQMLLSELSHIAIFPQMKQNDCPLFVPIRVKNRDKLYKDLIENSIYCPIHWPISNYHKLTNSQQKVYDEELSLVCDQRYSEDDMQKIISIVRNFERG